MKTKQITGMLITGLLSVALLVGCGNQDQDGLVIAKQGMFSSGGTVTEPVPEDNDETINFLYTARPGNTDHDYHNKLQ